MSYCPRCLAEYRAEIMQCAECGCDLVEGSLPLDQPSINPDTELVKLCVVADPAEADIIKAVLAEEGIQSLLRRHGPITGELAHVVDGVTHDHAIIYVTANRLEEAKRLLTALLEAPVQWPVGMEPDESADIG